MITIYSLIFQSKDYADWIWNSVHKNTPLIKEGKAEFVIMLNNPTPEVYEYVRNKYYYDVHLCSNPASEAEMNSWGLAGPTYLYSVYGAYNKCLYSSSSEYICLLNSDMYPAPGWLEALLKHANENTITTSRLVEPRRNGNLFRNFITKKSVVPFDGGYGLKDFNPKQFEEFAALIKEDTTEPLVSYQPIMFHRSIINKIGLYPLGNVLSDGQYEAEAIRIHNNKWIEYGDMYYIRKARQAGINCIQVNDSIAYHFDNGERLNK